MKCPNCGKDGFNNKYCIECGTKLDNEPVINKDAFKYRPYKKNNTGLYVTIIVISVIIILGITLSIILLVNGNKNKSRSEIINYNIEDIEIDDDNNKYNENIKYQEYFLEKGSMLLFVENNNKEEVTVNATVEYYDKNNKIVDSKQNVIFVLAPLEKNVMELYEPYEKYDNYRITIDSYKNDSYNSYKQDIKINHKKDDENGVIVVDYINNSNVNLNMLVIGVVYYNNGKIVAFNYDSALYVKSKEKNNMKIFYPYDNNTYEDIEFDDYEIYIIDAYKSNY